MHALANATPTIPCNTSCNAAPRAINVAPTFPLAKKEGTQRNATAAEREITTFVFKGTLYFDNVDPIIRRGEVAGTSERGAPSEGNDG